MAGPMPGHSLIPTAGFAGPSDRRDFRRIWAQITRRL